MKKIMINKLLLAFGLLLSGFVSAQNFTSIQYTVGVPFGDLKDHTSNLSGRGLTFQFQTEIEPAITVGINLGYSVFYERKAYDSYSQGTATLTGVQYRYNNMFPMMVNAHYAFGTRTIMPYLGLGVGTLYNMRSTQMGLYSVKENNWHFLLSPELGFMVDLSADIGIKINAIYDNAFKTREMDAFGNLRLNIGFIFMSF
ncbi:MAG: hypothetical protein RBR87_00955 [Bacteroidales bacterium]|nr:hypothetical protein [Bacteroidales bacterium]